MMDRELGGAPVGIVARNRTADPENPYEVKRGVHISVLFL